MSAVAFVADPSSSTLKSRFLADILAALAKRRRALRHKTGDIAVEKVLEATSGAEDEKLEISCDVGPARLRLFAWADRWIFIDARTATKTGGWEWEFSQQGRLLGGEARALIGVFERSIDATAMKSTESLEDVWKPLLASGPRLSG